MGLVSNCRRLRIDIALWVLFLLNCSVTAAQIQGIIKHVKDLTNQDFSDKHHQLNQIVDLETSLSASCEFNGSLCGYRIIQDIGSQKVTWSLISKTFNNTQHSPKGNYVALVGSGEEGARSFIQSPNFQTTSKDRVEFFYYLSGDNPGQLQLTFIQNNTKIGRKSWSDVGDHGAGLNYGCMELPPNRTGHLMFTGILGLSTERIIAVQKVSISQGSCNRGVQRYMCTFDNALLCNYIVHCSATSEYTWKRHKGATPTFGTGPNGDPVKPFNGFYLYAESSYGSQGDSASVSFPVSNTTGRYLYFRYYMYGKGIGSLHLRYHFGQSSKEEWTLSGEQGDKWQYFCQRIVDNIDAFSLIAVRGSSHLGDIAIDNVRVDKNCLIGSLDCNFNTMFICGYSIISQWSRVKGPDGFYMNAKTSPGVHSMKSPTVDVLDSCVRIHYQMLRGPCKLIIYKNQQILFNLAPSITNLRSSAQFYVKQATIHLEFEAKITTSCEISIHDVSVVKGRCPDIKCPRRMTICNDGHFCVAKDQMCNGQKDCKDGSDEICPNSLACDFEYFNNCGYKGIGSYERFEDGGRNDSDYHIILYAPDSDWKSPMQHVNDSCIQFFYRGKSSARVRVLLLYAENSTSTLVWESSFPKAETSWSVGQFFISAGIVQLVFNVKGQFASEFNLDDIRLIPGSCPPLDCGKDYVPCARNKCIKKTDICNRQIDCMDKSDEANCTPSIDCDFEQAHLCGYQFGFGWGAKSGFEHYSPRHDKSTGTFYGHYMAQLLLNKSLYTPEITLENITCVRFYYHLREDDSVFHVYNNNVSRLRIKSNNIDKWQMIQLQLSAGKHTLSFKQTSMGYLTTLAIDSLSTTPGRCPQMDCPDKWGKCASADICVPRFRFCDGEIDCPNGEDENNCTANSTLRLVRGQDVNQGYVEYRLNGTWNEICYENENNPSSKSNAKVACRELGYNGDARDTFRTAIARYVLSNITHLNCRGNEASISECSMKYCTNCYCHHYFSVDCSNHHCLSDQVPCPGQNGKPYSHSSSCIWKYNLCDGEYDCPGGTDEQNCKECSVSEFRCRNRECVPQRYRCNGVPDCQDSSDEHDCFIQNVTTVFVVQNGKYEALCENNINNQQIANELCKAVERGNGTILQSDKSGQGIKFTVSSNSKEGILPGYYPVGVVSCKLLNLMCNLKSCGSRAFMSKNEPNIRYGIFALPGEWPWQVVLHRNSQFICGGTLISERYVLTAAHCTRKLSAYYSVSVGSVSRTSGQLISVKKVIPHIGYDPDVYRHDVALLELSSPVKINNFTQIACLPSKPATPKSLCFTTGWGANEKGNYPIYLKEAKVHILATEICKSYYKHSDKVVVCANHPEPHQPACFGDSGGPLQCLNEYGHWELIGVTSYGKAECLGHVSSPEAYADVYAHLAWIIENAPNLYQ